MDNKYVYDHDNSVYDHDNSVYDHDNSVFDKISNYTRGISENNRYCSITATGIFKVIVVSLLFIASIAGAGASIFFIYKGIKNAKAQGLSLKDAVKSPLLLNPGRGLLESITVAATILIIDELEECIIFYGSPDRLIDDNLFNKR